MTKNRYTNKGYIESHKQVMDELLLNIPFVKGGQAFGYPAYKNQTKTFCFVGGDGISIKLSKEKIVDLIEQFDAFHPFYPAEGILWKGWVSIVYENSDDYRQHLDLYEESVDFVSE
jgi:hypothetical protein